MKVNMSLYTLQTMTPVELPQLAMLHECPSVPVKFHPNRPRLKTQPSNNGMLSTMFSKGESRWQQWIKRVRTIAISVRRATRAICSRETLVCQLFSTRLLDTKGWEGPAYHKECPRDLKLVHFQLDPKVEDDAQHDAGT